MKDEYSFASLSLIDLLVMRYVAIRHTSEADDRTFLAALDAELARRNNPHGQPHKPHRTAAQP